MSQENDGHFLAESRKGVSSQCAGLGKYSRLECALQGALALSVGFAPNNDAGKSSSVLSMVSSRRLLKNCSSSETRNTSMGTRLLHEPGTHSNQIERGGNHEVL